MLDTLECWPVRGPVRAADRDCPLHTLVSLPSEPVEGGGREDYFCRRM